MKTAIIKLLTIPFITITPNKALIEKSNWHIEEIPQSLGTNMVDIGHNYANSYGLKTIETEDSRILYHEDEKTFGIDAGQYNCKEYERREIKENYYLLEHLRVIEISTPINATINLVDCAIEFNYSMNIQMFAMAFTSGNMPTTLDYNKTLEYYVYTYGRNAIDEDAYQDQTEYLTSDEIHLASGISTETITPEQTITYYFYSQFESNQEPEGTQKFIQDIFHLYMDYTINGNVNVEINPIDITGIMFKILTMPFTFLSAAFDFTIFAGTPYQLNISNFLLSLLMLAIAVYIIRKVFKK